MVITVDENTSKEELDKKLEELSSKRREHNRKKKLDILKKIWREKLFSEIDPIKMQKELRNEWK